MSIFKERFMLTVKKLIPKRENIHSLVISIIIIFLFFLGFHFLGNYFTGTIWIINTIILGFLILIIMIMAGFAVLKSLFLVAAELTLIIFLAQSYCDVPTRFTPGDKALKSLLVIGVLYIIISFCRSLYEVIKNNYRKVKKDRWSIGEIIIITIYSIFAIMFIWQIYQVVSPIILNLCVYR